MAHLYFVRHAKAGERREWTDDDTLRPLSKAGWRQAELLAKRLVKVPAKHLLSSEYVRCIQTLEPTAKRLGLLIQVDERLTEGAPFEPMLELLAQAPGDTVLCSHGDLIPDTLCALQRRGTEIRTQPDWRKASTWVLKRNKHGVIVHATVWPPPA
jgi:8-oxo-dGTP diphosphatase